MKWPNQDEESIIEYFGHPGHHLMRVTVPYPLIIAWDTSKQVNSFICHEKVSASIKRVLRGVSLHYSLPRVRELGLDIWGGCYNLRRMTGGKRLSLHSWGIAIDWDPENNQYNQTSVTATLAQPEYEKWWEIWEDEGWVSLGRERDLDWMHVQAARL